MGCLLSIHETVVATPVAPRAAATDNDTIHIAWSGGSSNAITFAGAYQALWERGAIDRIAGAAGSSAGSLFAVASVIGTPAAVLQAALMQLDTSAFADVAWDPITWYEQRGLCRGDVLERWTESFIAGETDTANCTFAQLYDRTQRPLRLSVYNLTRAQSEFWDHTSHPNVVVSRAVRASASYPGLFAPIQYGDSVYVDGGVGNILPTDAFPNCLGLAIANVAIAPVDISSYASALIGTLLNQIYQSQHTSADRIISLSGAGKHPWDFALTSDEKTAAITAGYTDTLSQIQSRNLI